MSNNDPKQSAANTSSTPPSPPPKSAPVGAKPAAQPISDANKELLNKATQTGAAIIKGGGSKAEAARAMFQIVHALPRDTVIAAFVAGATVTPKGAPTYYYNVFRKFKREQQLKAGATQPAK